jgi:hypothetical protein
VSGISAENAQAGFGGLLIGYSFGIGILGDFQIFLSERAARVE